MGKGLWKGGKGGGKRGGAREVVQGVWVRRGKGGWNLYFNEILNKTDIVSSD